jgi:hypothetical protein
LPTPVISKIAINFAAHPGQTGAILAICQRVTDLEAGCEATKQTKQLKYEHGRLIRKNPG